MECVESSSEASCSSSRTGHESNSQIKVENVSDTEDGPFGGDAPAGGNAQSKTEPKSIGTHCATHWPHDRKCEFCIRARLQAIRRLRGVNKKMVDEPGVRWHFDTMGPTDEALHKERYLVVGWDEGSEYLKGLPVKGRTALAVMDATRRGLAGEEKAPKQIRCDGGGEFDREFKDFWEGEKKALMDKSVPGRPTTNSRIEDKCKRVRQGTAATKLQAGSPYCFWAFAAVICCKNQSMTRLNRHGETPYKSLRKKDPPRAVPFGCRVFFLDAVAVHMKTDRKFDARGKPGILLGYAQHRAYTVMDLELYKETRGEVRTYITRDVRLIEDSFPFQELASMQIFKQLNPRMVLENRDQGGAGVLGDEVSECFICFKSVAMVLITCPACRGRRRVHNRDATCLKGRCEGHTVAECIVMAIEREEPDRLAIIRALDKPDDYVLSNFRGLKTDGMIHETTAPPMDVERHDDPAETAKGLPPRRRIPSLSVQRARAARATEAAEVIVSEGNNAGDLQPRTLGFDAEFDAAAADEPEPMITQEDGGVIPDGEVPDVAMSMTACAAPSGRIPLYDSPFGLCFAMASTHGPQAPVFASLQNPRCLCSTRVKPDAYLPANAWPQMVLVSRAVAANSDEFKYDERIEKATESEVRDNIVGRGVWDHDSPREWDEVAAEDPTAEWVRAHIIACIKNCELDEEYWVAKARVVLNGGDTRNVWGEQINEVSLYTLPSSLDSFRVTVGVNHARGGEMVTFDVNGAYVQIIRTGPPTWATPPKRMYTEKMKRMRNPVVKMRTWLYGEKGAGEGYAWGFEQKAKAIGWQMVEECAGETVFEKTDATMGLYVDDGYVA